MTSEIFKAIVISGTAGAVFGVLIKHIMDTRHINELRKLYEDALNDWRVMYDKHIGEWREVVKQYQQRIFKLEAEKRALTAVKAVKFQPEIKAAVSPDWLKDFMDVSKLPEGNDPDWIELDFPNSNEEGTL